MADYLIEQYNEKMQAIQDREAKKLAGALEIYTCATFAVTEAAALERVEAGAALAAAMSQRDHEYHNGRSAPTEDTPTRAAVAGAVLLDSLAAERSQTLMSATAPKPGPLYSGVPYGQNPASTGAQEADSG